VYIELMYRGPSRSLCITTILPTLLGFEGIPQLFSPSGTSSLVSRSARAAVHFHGSYLHFKNPISVHFQL